MNDKNLPGRRVQVKKARRVKILSSRKAYRPPVLVVQPREDKLLAELAHTLEQFRFTSGWISFIPAYIGSTPLVDHAACALVAALHCIARSDTYSVARAMCAPSYGMAVVSLRRQLAGGGSSALAASSDQILLATALLACVDWTLQPSCGSSFYTHAMGINAVLFTLPMDQSLSAIACALLAFHWVGTFQVPVSLGVSSSFEGSMWLAAKTSSHSHSTPQPLAALTDLSKDLFIRLPRLIALVRSLRNGNTTPLLLQKATTLALDLFALKDDDAESAVLHNVLIRKTTHPADALVTPVSLYFPHNGDFAAALCYWQTRILVQRLCTRLQDLTPLLAGIPNAQDLHVDNLRKAKNIIMSWEFACASGGLGRWALRIGMLASWAVTIDLDSEGWPLRVSKAHLRFWIGKRYNALHGQTSGFEESDLDEAADLLLGGPLSGFLTVIR